MLPAISVEVSSEKPGTSPLILRCAALTLDRAIARVIWLRCMSRLVACAVRRRRFPVVQVLPGNRSSRKQPEQSWR
jgi:hypothetical protein